MSLYDRQRDPTEKHDIYSELPGTAKSIRAELDRWEDKQLRRIECKISSANSAQ